MGVLHLGEVRLDGLFLVIPGAEIQTCQQYPQFDPFGDMEFVERSPQTVLYRFGGDAKAAAVGAVPLAMLTIIDNSIFHGLLKIS